MIAVWLGVALLSVSWLFGLGYYHPVDWTGWSITIALGTLCMLKFPAQGHDRKTPAIAFLLGLPAILVASGPYRAAIVLLVGGLLLRSLPRVPRGIDRAATAATAAGALLLVQSLGIGIYAAVTSRSHELAAPLPAIIGGVARLLGIEAAVHGDTIALHSMRKVHLLGATRELVLDPATFCFGLAAIAALAWMAQAAVPAEQRKGYFLRAALICGLSLAIWLPVRAGLLMALYLHDVLRTDYGASLESMRLFWNPWLHLVLLVPPALLCWRLAPLRGAPLDRDRPDAGRAGSNVWKQLPGSIAAAAGVGLVVAGVGWDPVGTRQQGRVIVEEHHPVPEKIWERTDRPYDTSWYGQPSGYNYYCIYDYCSRFYAMQRQTQPIDDLALEQGDVLIIKVPTRPFSQAEMRSVQRFVERGGGLLLIGEHTNVFRTSDYLNPLARRFGFQFRNDCLFGIDAVFEDRYEPPLVPHPILQHMPPLDFATSCSIDPGSSSGRAVIRGLRLKNLMADYHADNYYPQPDNDAEMRYGAFIQLWATRYGQGRVVAFSDSTIFSNFCAFEPGKAELMLGMIEWLNHRSRFGDPRPWLIGSGILVLLGSLVCWRSCRGDGWLLVTSGLLGWAVTVPCVNWAHRAAMPEPEAKRPFLRVVIDRSLCDGPLAKNGFTEGSGEGFGIVERWILRLGYFPVRRQGSTVWNGDAVIFFHPCRIVSETFRQQAAEFVASGGKILIIDSPQNEDSTSNDLLRPFQVAVDRSARRSGLLETAGGWPPVPVRNAATVRGGEPFAWVAGQPVGTTVRHGRGRIAIVGFGERFADANMGGSVNVVPDNDLKAVYDVLFSLLRAMVESDSPGAIEEAPLER